MTDPLADEKNKRLTINLLIQGAASHAFLTAHHLVRDELEAIRPGLTALYDRWVLSSYLNYWIGDVGLLFGMPWRYWRKIHRPSHPFHRHPFLVRHGAELSRASKRYVVERCAAKGVRSLPVVHYFQLVGLYVRVHLAEQGHEPQLIALAKRAASLIWDIDESRLEAELTLGNPIEFGNVPAPKSWAGRVARRSAVGYGGVERRENQFVVVAKARNWPLVLHELIKGTAELVGLHGLNRLDDETYMCVIEETDRIEHEFGMLLAGAELWRRLLAVVPQGRPLAETLMHIARMEPAPLERLMFAVVGDAERAKRLLAECANP